MKLALISDIHGNYHALEAVLDDIRRQQADRVFVLGDIVFKGPLPERCVEAVRQLETVVLQGNIDELVGTNRIQPGFAKSAGHEAALKQEMAWVRSRLTEDQLNYLTELPMEHQLELENGQVLRLVHATPQNVLDVVTPMEDEAGYERMFAGSKADIVAYGHIHLGYVRSFGGKMIINTGSVGLPFDGNWRASYALLEVTSGGVSVTLRRVEYDLEAAVQAFDGSGHPFADSVIAAIRSGRKPE